MHQKIKEIILNISKDIKIQLPRDFEKQYYSKMAYSGINKILDVDVALLRDTIALEVALIHVVVYLMSNGMKDIKLYNSLLTVVDTDNFFSFYKINDDNIITQLNNCSSVELGTIYGLINEHDKLIDKEVKKKFGQFYTPTFIVKKMISEIKINLKNLTNQDFVIDPACGTGVFVIETLKELNNIFDFNTFLNFVSNNFFAYDVNPFAVVATKINILNTLLESVTDINVKETIICTPPTLSNIVWKNSITENEENKFTIILGNPPYFKMDLDMTKDVKGYDSIIYGQPNIYSLFMYWGINHLNKDGIMSFIVPQSIRSGLYFKNLRAEMKNLRIKTILHIDSRQNIFDRAEQAVLVISLQNKPVANSKTRIQFYNKNKNVLSEFSIPRSKLMMDKSNNFMFIINKKYEMYDILDKIYKNNSTLSDTAAIAKFSNGLFVWNQHKDDITDNEDGTIPVIYGGNVQPVKFCSDITWSNKERKKYATVTDKTKHYVLEAKRLLVQRTTNFEKSIRLKACLITDEFLQNHNRYFLENHVNFLCSVEGKNVSISEEIMNYYLGMLNSKLINYIFTSKSGNTQVSANELNLLPFPDKNISEISNFISTYSLNINKHQEELDRLVCEAFELSEKEIEIIANY